MCANFEYDSSLKKLYVNAFVYTTGKYIGSTSTDKIFEKNSSSHVKYCITRKVQFLFSRSLLLVLTKFPFWGGDWALDYTSMKF